MYRNPVNKTVFLALLFIPIFSGALYSAIGNAKAYEISQLIQEMQVHLQKDPESREGWYLLGKLYLSQNRTTEAAEAFAKAGVLKNYTRASIGT